MSVLKNHEGVDVVDAPLLSVIFCPESTRSLLLTSLCLPCIVTVCGGVGVGIGVEVGIGVGIVVGVGIGVLVGT